MAIVVDAASVRQARGAAVVEYGQEVRFTHMVIFRTLSFLAC